MHIASHFSFNAAKEETSFLLLGDGSYLSVEEMQNSPGIFERVELLTLSACDTATTGANGKEVEGMAFVAQDLGAKAVVASLWPVADIGTEVLMREFYRLRQANPQWSKAEALRQAQLALLKGKQTSSEPASGDTDKPTSGNGNGTIGTLSARHQGAVRASALLGAVHSHRQLEVVRTPDREPGGCAGSRARGARRSRGESGTDRRARHSVYRLAP